MSKPYALFAASPKNDTHTQADAILSAMRCLLLFAPLLLLSARMVAQDVVYSQFYANPVQLNPALTGTAFAPRLAANYRNQWPSLPSAYTSYGVAYDEYIGAAKSGVGLSILSDNAANGLYTTTNINLSYAYQMQFGRETFVGLGLEAGMKQARVDWDKLVFYDQLSPTIGYDPALVSQEKRPAETSKWYPDFGVGMVAYNSQYFGGFSIKHINAPDESLRGVDAVFAPLPVRLTLHGGAQYDIFTADHRKRKGEYYISPNIILTKQANFYQATAGAFARLGQVSAGAWLRYSGSNADAAIFSLGFHQSVFRIGYSYDFTLSRLTAAGGAHELSLLLNFGADESYQRKHRNMQYNDCMRIFR